MEDTSEYLAYSFNVGSRKDKCGTSYVSFDDQGQNILQIPGILSF